MEKEELEGKDDDDASVESDTIQQATYLEELIPTVRYTDVVQFKNVFCEEDILSTIHALYGGISLRSELEKENERRERDPKFKTPHERQNKLDPGLDTAILHQIRIQSPCVMKYLSSAMEIEIENPWQWCTFNRPFTPLVHCQPRMKEALAKLERMQEEESGLHSMSWKSIKWPIDPGPLLYSQYALNHMRAYVKFMEERVMPLSSIWRGLDTAPRSILFTDIWYLFQEGDLVFQSSLSRNKESLEYEGPKNDLTAQTSRQVCWRVYSIVMPENGPDPFEIQEGALNTDDAHVPRGADDDMCADKATIKIWCYYIDYDGEAYRPVRRQFQIFGFTGKLDVRSLPIYPTRFLPNEEEFLSAQKLNGESFKNYIGQKQVYYSGWTLTDTPTGTPLDGVDKYPEHVESEVIVDFTEAYQTVTSWKPNFFNPQISQVKPPEMVKEDTLHANVRSYSVHRNDVSTFYLYYMESDGVGVRRRNQAISSDVFLSAVRKGTIAVPSGESLALLPKRLIVYSLLQRKFIHANIRYLEVIEPAFGIFDKLSINPNHKLLVRSLVREHFRKKQRRHEGQDVQYQEIVRGKGTGLVFLLHGVPGVGKTATAEAVAQDSRKPLFPITCGDIGFEPGELEKNLTRIFRLANLWDCILLLDEADIFFTRRTPNDLQRNALVTVFLRTLEYYNGILFLTTNRVGIIDEAFKSRIHMTLYYPPLSLVQYRQIFDLNIKRVEEIEALNQKNEEQRVEVDADSIRRWSEEHYHNTPEIGRWNGRQIKNAFQIAASLAHYSLFDGGGDSLHERRDIIKGSRPGVLDAAQFSIVAQTTHEFDDYMAITKKGTDGELAKKDGVRNDNRPLLGVQDPHHQHHSSPSLYGDPYRSPGSRLGPGQGYSQSGGPPRYSAPQESYRESHANAYYSQEPTRWVPGTYGQPLRPPSSQAHQQEPSRSPSHGYASTSGSGQDVLSEYEMSFRSSDLQSARRPRSDERSYTHD